MPMKIGNDTATTTEPTLESLGITPKQAIDYAAQRFGVAPELIEEAASALPDMGNTAQQIMQAAYNLSKGRVKVVKPDNKAAEAAPFDNRVTAEAYKAGAITKPERTWGQAAKDMGLGVAQGMIGANEAVIGAANTLLGFEDAVEANKRRNDVSGALDSVKSAGLLVQNQKAEDDSKYLSGRYQSVGVPAEIADALATTGAILNNPAKLSDVAAQGVGSIAVSLPLAATTGALGASAIMGGGAAANEAVDRIVKDDAAMAQLSDVYQQAFMETGSQDKALEITARKVQLPALVVGGALSALATKVTGGGKVEQDLLAGKMTTAKIPVSMLREGGEEALQSPSEQVGANVAIMDNIDRNQTYMEGTGKAFGEGLIGGMAAGGAMGAAGAASSRATQAKRKLADEITKLKVQRDEKLAKAQAAAALPAVGQASAGVDQMLGIQTANQLAQADSQLQGMMQDLGMIEQIERAQVMPQDPELKALAAQGVPVVEVTPNQPQPYPIQQVLDRAIDTQKQVEIEAAYRKRDAKLERQKELDYVEAQLQALDEEHKKLRLLQSTTPVSNNALRDKLSNAIKEVEVKQAAQEAIRQEIMATGNPRLVEAGIEEMQGVEVPELPVAITPELAESYAPKLPENFADERLLDEAYRVVLGEVFDNTTKGGGVSLAPVAGTGYTGGDGNEYGQQMTRTKSINHPITQALIADGYTAEEVKAAIDASLKGQKLGKRWQGLVAKALDYSNADAADIRASMAEFEQAKADELGNMYGGLTLDEFERLYVEPKPTAAPAPVVQPKATQAPVNDDADEMMALFNEALTPQGKAEANARQAERDAAELAAQTRANSVSQLVERTSNAIKYNRYLSDYDFTSGAKRDLVRKNIANDIATKLSDEQLRSLENDIAQKEAQIKQWQDKVYKANTKTVTAGTDEGDNQSTSVSIGYVNEKRRNDVIRSLRDDIDGLLYMAAKGTYRPTQETVAQPEAKKAASESIETPVANTEVQAKPLPQERIDDVGESIAGAKKMTFKFTDALAADVDIASVPLSKSFPKPDYVAMAKAGADHEVLSLVAMLRDEIPTKPKVAYRLKSWVSKVESAREIASQLMENATNGTLSLQRVYEVFAGADKILKPLVDVALLASNVKPEQIETLSQYRLRTVQGKVNKSVMPDYDAAILADDTEDNGLVKGTFFQVENVNNNRERAYFLNYANAQQYILDAVQAKSESTSGEKRVDFGVFSVRGQKGYQIGKKVSSGKFITLETGIASIAEAKAMIANDYDRLKAKYDAIKDIPSERKAINNPRIGEDYRNGRDVTAAEFAETFGFRGVQFGNYVDQGKRQEDLNNAYDGFMDLAGIIGVPPKALSLNGELGMAFGARGSGGKNPAKAHYEPDMVVINMTKANGSGSLAHEWFHALDNYFSRLDNEKGKMDFASEKANPMARPEVMEAWKNLRLTIKNETQLFERSIALDSGRSKDYWSTVLEMVARSFERYVIDKLAEKGFESDYLANIIDAKDWDALQEVYASMGIDKKPYPYPLDAEAEKTNAAYDALFDAIETKVVGDKVVLFSFAGRKAKTANLDNLANAEARIAAGEDAEVVRQETGWHQGVDGKWRFEIDDSGAKLLTESSNPDKFKNVFDEAARKKNGVKLSQVLSHPALFEAYPSIKKVRVIIDDESDSEAAFNPSDMAIAIKTPTGSSKSTKSTLSAIIHEIQHAIQEVEGFAKGGDPSEMIGSEQDKFRRVMNTTVLLMGFLDYSRDEALDAFKNEYGLYDKQIEVLRKMPVDVFDFGVEFNRNQPAISEDQYAEYFALAGEVEARNTQKRLGMNAQERKLTAPSATQDVPNEKQIVRFEGGRVDYASQPKTLTKQQATEIISQDADGKRLLKNGKVKVLGSIDEAPDNVQNQIALSDADGNIQGFFDPATDTTYLVADALTADTIQGVLVHEVGVHAWWAKANSDKKAALEKRAMQLLSQGKYGNDKIKAFYAAVEQRMIDADVQGNAEEAAAYIVEEAINQAKADKSKLSDSRMIDWVAKNISQSLANFLSDFISSVRASMHRIGWLNTANLTGADLVAIAKRNMREVAQNDVGDNVGILADDMAGDVAYSKAGTTQPANNLIAPRETFKDRLIVDYVDDMNRVKQLQDMVNEKVGADSSQVYDAAMRYRAITPSRLLDMQRSVERIIQGAAKDGVTSDVLGLYMYAVHAPERNAYLFERDGTENGSGMTDTQAADIVAQLKQEYPNIDNHAQSFRKLLDAVMTMRVINGTVSQAQADEWKAKMPNYVPLKNSIEDGAEFEANTGITQLQGFAGMGTGTKFNLTGKEIKRANGRVSQAGHILENAMFDMQKGIVRAEKNNVLVEFARTVARHRDAVFNGKALWDVYGKKPDNMTNVVEYMVDGRRGYIRINDQSMYEAFAKMDGDAFTWVDSAVQFIKKTITAWNPAYTIVNLVRDTQTALLNGSQELGVKGAAKMVAYVPSAMASSWRYERGSQNEARNEWDKWHERYRLAGGKTGFLDVRPIEKIQRDINNLFRINNKAVTWKDYALKTGNAMGQVVKVVEDAGGVTENMWRLAAFRVAVEQGKSVKEAARIAKNLTVNFDRRGKNRQTLEKVFLFYNAAIQGTVRMKQSMAAKGALAIVGGLMAAGFLAAGQDWEDEEGNNLFDLLPEHEKMRGIPIVIADDGKRYVIPMAYGFGYFVYMGMKLRQMQRYVETNGMQGVSIEKGLSDLFNGAALHFNPFGGQQFAEAIKGENDQLIGLLTPVITDPFVQIATNKNAFGGSLYPENAYNPNDRPDSEKAFEHQKSSIYYDIARTLSRATGGDGVKDGFIEVAPATLEALVRAFTGGAGQFVEKTLTLATRAASDEMDMVEPANVPVGSVLYKKGQDKLYYDAYQELVKDVQKAANDLKRYNKGDSDTGDVPMEVESKWQLRLTDDAKQAKKALDEIRDEEKALNKEYRAADDKDTRAALRAEIERLKAQKVQIQSEFIRRGKEERATGDN